jgi:chaperonin GroES
MTDRPSPSRPRSDYDLIEPIGRRVVIRKDDNRRVTKSGIVLPDSHEIPVITGRVVAISKEIENDDDHTIRQYDKVLFDPREAVPVELEQDNRLFVVSLDRVLAILRRSDPGKVSESDKTEQDRLPPDGRRVRMGRTGRTRGEPRRATVRSSAPTTGRTGRPPGSGRSRRPIRTA